MWALWQMAARRCLEADSACAASSSPPFSTTEEPRGSSESGLVPEDLRVLHILRQVAIESVWGLLEDCPVHVLQKGDMLLKAGQANQTLYMVLSGRVSVHLEKPSSEPVAHLGAGETVGELSVLDAHPVSAFVLAAERSRLLAVDEETFWRLVRASHPFAVNLLFLLTQRMRANNSAITEGAKLRRQFEREATVDALTNVHNRRWLNDMLPRFYDRHRRSRQPFSLLVIDVDFFKKFNDAFGHLAGDKVLITVGRTLSTHIRPTDFVARYGGEEFVVVLPDTDLHEAMLVAERVRTAVFSAEITGPEGSALPHVTVSIGAAAMADDDVDALSMLDRGDKALYRAKQGGRNRVERETREQKNALTGDER